MIGIEVMKNLAPDQDWVRVNGDYDQFHVYGDVEIHEDYVACTAALMRKAAMKCFVFPLYVHFEGYEDCMDAILLARHEFDIHYQNSGRTVLTMADGKTYHAEIPSFTVTIANEELLRKVFAKWFHFAQENCMWLITQNFALQYKDHFACIDMKKESVILLADHDAQSLSFITSDPLYRKEEQLGLLFSE